MATKPTTKKWYTSKELWFNVVYTLAEVTLVVLDYVPEKYIPALMAFQGAMTVVLRVFFTDSKLTLK